MFQSYKRRDDDDFLCIERLPKKANVALWLVELVDFSYSVVFRVNMIKKPYYYKVLLCPFYLSRNYL